MASTVFYTDYITSTLTFGTALTSVASAGYSVPSGLIDNTFTGGNNRQQGTLLLTFSSALTAGAGVPYIVLYPLLLPDGSTYPTPPGNAAAAPAPNAYQLPRQVVASTAYSALVWRGIDLEPAKYAFMFFNSSGVAWTSGGTITATLYRFTPQIV